LEEKCELSPHGEQLRKIINVIDNLRLDLAAHTSVKL
jgi:hypothetical protein